MDKRNLIERHLDLCERVFEEMMREGSWPWRDSRNPEDLVESKDNQSDV